MCARVCVKMSAVKRKCLFENQQLDYEMPLLCPLCYCGHSELKRSHIHTQHSKQQIRGHLWQCSNKHSAYLKWISLILRLQPEWETVKRHWYKSMVNVLTTKCIMPPSVRTTNQPNNSNQFIRRKLLHVEQQSVERCRKWVRIALKNTAKHTEVRGMCEVKQKWCKNLRPKLSKCELSKALVAWENSRIFFLPHSVA